ncbi:MAG: hypothetical protein ACK5PB_08360 [Pirellula sp.]|jgi:hypothetical protein
MAEKLIHRASQTGSSANLDRNIIWQLAAIGCLFVLINATGCDSSSTIDSVINSPSNTNSPAANNATGGAGVGFGEMVGSNQSPNSSPPQSPTPPSHAGTAKSNTGASDPNGLGLGASGINTDLSDVSTRLDPPKISRSDFVIRLSLSAREQLLEETKKPGNAYLLVGKVTTTKDDWQHISFVDYYEPDRQYQFRTNGVKILVPRELVNRLHNATIDLDSDSKRYFVTLAR